MRFTKHTTPQSVDKEIAVFLLKYLEAIDQLTTERCYHNTESQYFENVRDYLPTDKFHLHPQNRANTALNPMQAFYVTNHVNME